MSCVLFFFVFLFFAFVFRAGEGIDRTLDVGGGAVHHILKAAGKFSGVALDGEAVAQHQRHQRLLRQLPA